MRIVGGKFRGKKILSPIQLGTRPTSDRARETIFNVLLHNPHFSPQLLTESTVLDGFAGTGALGLEAFSRGAKSVHFLENNKDILPILRKNVASFGLPTTCVFEVDVTRLRTLPMHPYSLVFLDPPYGKGLLAPSLIYLFDKGYLAEGSVVVLECAKDEPLDLPHFLSIVTEKFVGLAKILFCKVHLEK